MFCTMLMVSSLSLRVYLGNANAVSHRTNGYATIVAPKTTSEPSVNFGRENKLWMCARDMARLNCGVQPNGIAAHRVYGAASCDALWTLTKRALQYSQPRVKL